MNALRIIMEVLRTAAAVIAACVLLSHSPYAGADVKSFSQSRLPGKWSWTDEQVNAMAILQLEAWSSACGLTKFECRDIVMPRVAYGLLPYLYGSYDVGSRTIIVDIRIFAQPIAFTVMVHEMIHYIQGKRDFKPGTVLITQEQSCKGEKEAHDLVRKFVDQTGVAKDDVRVRKWEDAAIGYRCTVEGKPLFLFP